LASPESYNIISKKVDKLIGKRKGKKTAKLLVLCSIFCIVSIVSAGILTSFATINTQITVDKTALQVEGHNAPYTVQTTFTNATPGDIYYQTINFTNIRNDCYFDVNYTAVCDEGLSVVLLNETGVEKDWFRVYANETRYMEIKWQIDLLAEVGNYTGTVTFYPEEAGFI